MPHFRAVGTPERGRHRGRGAASSFGVRRGRADVQSNRKRSRRTQVNASSSTVEVAIPGVPDHELQIDRLAGDRHGMLRVQPVAAPLFECAVPAPPMPVPTSAAVPSGQPSHELEEGAVHRHGIEHHVPRDGPAGERAGGRLRFQEGHEEVIERAAQLLGVLGGVEVEIAGEMGGVGRGAEPDRERHRVVRGGAAGGGAGATADGRRAPVGEEPVVRHRDRRLRIVIAHLLRRIRAVLRVHVVGIAERARRPGGERGHRLSVPGGHVRAEGLEDAHLDVRRRGQRAAVREREAGGDDSPTCAAAAAGPPA